MRRRTERGQPRLARSEAAFGLPLAILFLGCAVVTSNKGVERGYHRDVYRVVTLGRDRAMRDQ